MLFRLSRRRPRVNRLAVPEWVRGARARFQSETEFLRFRA